MAHVSIFAASGDEPVRITSGGWNPGAPIPFVDFSNVAVPKSDSRMVRSGISMRLSGLMSL